MMRRVSATSRASVFLRFITIVRLNKDSATTMTQMIILEPRQRHPRRIVATEDSTP